MSKGQLNHREIQAVESVANRTLAISNCIKGGMRSPLEIAEFVGRGATRQLVLYYLKKFVVEFKQYK